jgi:hypothetical protein
VLIITEEVVRLHMIEDFVCHNEELDCNLAGNEKLVKLQPGTDITISHFYDHLVVVDV